MYHNPDRYVKNKCGADESSTKPYLLYFDVQQCYPTVECKTPSICVSQCPQNKFVLKKDECTPDNLEEIKIKLICVDNVNIDKFTTCDEVQAAITKKTCAGWYFASERSEIMWTYIL